MIGNQIKDRRKFKGWTQAYVAKAVDCSQCLVAQWETGTRVPSVDKLPKLATLFGCKIDDLYQEV